MLPYRYNKWEIPMNNSEYTYDEYLEDDKKYREIEYLLEKYDVEINYKEYIENKYMGGK